MADPTDKPADEPVEPRPNGTPPGQATMPQPHGGRIGNPPFQPTDEQRAKVRTYAKTFPVNGEHFIARLIGISRNTLRAHFADDLELGRAEMLASVGSQMVNRAINAEAETVKGDIEAQKFILARLGGWTTKVETGDKAARPFGGDAINLSRLSADDLETYGRLSAMAEGLDPDDVVGTDDD